MNQEMTLITQFLNLKVDFSYIYLKVIIDDRQMGLFFL